jgi:hypothetical protein
VCVVMMKERVISAGLLYRPQVDRRRKGEHPEKKTKKKKIAVGEFFFLSRGHPFHVHSSPACLSSSHPSSVR